MSLLLLTRKHDRERHGLHATPAADAALEAELLADEKERAEHVMLVDLGRNDVGRVSEPGSVRVTSLPFGRRNVQCVWSGREPIASP